NLANRQKPGCGKGTGVDRSRTATTLSLKKKFKDKMSEFQALRESIHQEHREVVERRIYTVTGTKADEEVAVQFAFTVFFPKHSRFVVTTIPRKKQAEKTSNGEEDDSEKKITRKRAPSRRKKKTYSDVTEETPVLESNISNMDVEPSLPSEPAKLEKPQRRTRKKNCCKLVNSRFTQQELPAWKPILTPGWVIASFLAIAFLFIPIGLVSLFASERDLPKNETRKFTMQDPYILDYSNAVVNIEENANGSYNKLTMLEIFILFASVWKNLVTMCGKLKCEGVGIETMMRGDVGNGKEIRF
ncbi:hypothetical protein M8C21_021046, partial [Ambrosia artemisiifolia]